MKKLLLLIFMISFIACDNCEKELEKVNSKVLENLESFQVLNGEFLGLVHVDRGLTIEVELKNRAFTESDVYSKLESDLNLVLANALYNSSKLDSTLQAIQDCNDSNSFGEDIVINIACKQKLENANELLSLGLDNIVSVLQRIDTTETNIANKQMQVDSLDTDLIAIDSQAFNDLPNIDSILQDFGRLFAQLFTEEQNLRGCLSIQNPDVPNPLFDPKNPFD